MEGAALHASASERDVAAVAAAVEALEARLSVTEDGPSPRPPSPRRSEAWAARDVRRAAPDPSAASLLKVRAALYSSPHA